MVSRTGRIIARVAKTLPRNAELADLLELLADLLELDGADAFRLAAYRKAATRIRAAGDRGEGDVALRDRHDHREQDRRVHRDGRPGRTGQDPRSAADWSRGGH